MVRQGLDSSESSWTFATSATLVHGTAYRPQYFSNRFFNPRNRALSIRSGGRNTNSSGGNSSSSGRKAFSLSSLRGQIQPELSRKLFRLIKSENNLISAHEAAGKERISIATQLSEWGEQTGDEAISDISDKVGVVLSEIGEQEDSYAHAIDDSRGVLKAIRDTEKSVQPSRDGKQKITDEIAKLKSKEPESAKLVVLEQELVRAEAENLVAEAQLTNIVCDLRFFLGPGGTYTYDEKILTSVCRLVRS
jgi:hypothetical protein